MCRTANPAFYFFFFLFFHQATFFGSLQAQQCQEQIREAKAAFRNRDYVKASALFYEGWPCIASSNKSLFEAGLCHYSANQLERAIICFERIEKSDPNYNKELKWHLARCYHQSKNFRKALLYYKQYLKKIDQDDPRYSFIRNELIRCGFGLKYLRRESQALVESFGLPINSPDDEFAVTPGGPQSGRFYFSSDRKNKSEGSGTEGTKNEGSNSDLYYTQQDRGKWIEPQGLPSELNSRLNEEILDFSEEGSVLLFQRSAANTSAKLFSDTLIGEQAGIHYQAFAYPVIADIGDHALCMFQDSVLVFSSRRLGGYGAYDLYFTIFRNGLWSMPVNLGPEVNSIFNEDYPFLSKDGRTLYFSSDRLSSMGGYDIYRSRFQPEATKWTEPYNLGIPVNSPDDDTHFKLTNDGLAGVFTSNRKYDNYGKRDIYLVYFKEELEEQSEAAGGTPLSILLDKDTAQPKQVLTEDRSSNVAPQNRPAYLALDPVFYNDDENMEASKVQDNLELLARVLRYAIPMRVSVLGHAFEESQPTVNLYYSIKKAERIMEYLVERGANPKAITCIGLGSAFPLARTEINGRKPAQSDRYNKRVDIIVNGNPSEVRIQYPNPAVPEFLKVDPSDHFLKLTHSYYYSIFLGTYAGLLPKSMEPPGQALLWVEREQPGGPYNYYYGIYKSFKEAEVALQTLKPNYPNLPTLRAGFNGSWLQRNQIIDHVLEAPDLVLYMNYLNEKH